MNDAPVLRLQGITRRFGSLLANDDISLSLGAGEVLALLGENGAGKSTLVSILFGHYVADAGRIEVDGVELPPGDTRAALKAGIGMIHQHFTLAENLTVLDNVLLGTEPLWRWRTGRAQGRRRLAEAAQAFGLAIDPDARVADLSVGEKQRVEILKSLVRGARILVLDEPTAVLTPLEARSLFETLGRFTASGLSLIFISHKLDEVMRVADRVAVLKQGRKVFESAVADTTAAELASAMVGPGFVATPLSRGPARVDAPVVLAFDQVGCAGPSRVDLQAVDLQVRAGEIVAIAGVAGNGQQALAAIACGERAPTSGRLQVAGRRLPPRPRAWIDAGVARIPVDRLGAGVIGDATVAENATAHRMVAPRRAAADGPATACGTGFWSRRLRLLDAHRMQVEAEAIRAGYDVRLASIDQPIRMLSGGNIQKFILGRELRGAPSVVVACQPTWGLDVGAVRFVHGQLLAARDRGAAVLLLSEDLEEVFALADRIAVIHGGRLTEARDATSWQAESIGLAMAGAAA